MFRFVYFPGGGKLRESDQIVTTQQNRKVTRFLTQALASSRTLGSIAAVAVINTLFDKEVWLQT